MKNWGFLMSSLMTFKVLFLFLKYCPITPTIMTYHLNIKKNKGDYNQMFEPLMEAHMSSQCTQKKKLILSAKPIISSEVLQKLLAHIVVEDVKVSYMVWSCNLLEIHGMVECSERENITFLLFVLVRHDITKNATTIGMDLLVPKLCITIQSESLNK